MNRCLECGRVKASDRRWQRWLAACWDGKRFPWWFTHKIVCLGWYDCSGDWPAGEITTTRRQRHCLKRVRSPR